MDKLTLHRKHIEAIDKKILSLLVRRFAVAQKIGVHKRLHGLPLQDKKRERELIQSLIKEGKDLGVTAASIRVVWRSILREALSKE